MAGEAGARSGSQVDMRTRKERRCQHGFREFSGECLDCAAIQQGCKTPEEIQAFKEECAYWERYYEKPENQF
jgi:hypothetical protein